MKLAIKSKKLKTLKDLGTRLVRLQERKEKMKHYAGSLVTEKQSKAINHTLNYSQELWVKIQDLQDKCRRRNALIKKLRESIKGEKKRSYAALEQIYKKNYQNAQDILETLENLNR